MQIIITRVKSDKKHVLRNMMELYFYDMSEFDDDKDRLELNEAGLYEYGYLDHYWTEPGRYPYLATVDGKLAGFALVRKVGHNKNEYEVAEFFVLRKYRKKGVGTALMEKIFAEHKGEWQIETPERNGVGAAFWRAVIEKAAVGKIEETILPGRKRASWRFTNQ